MTSAASYEASRDDNSKISPAFAARLARLSPSEQIRAIVLPEKSVEAEPDGAVARPARRESVAKSIAAQTLAAFAAIDRQLATTGGRRLTEAPNRLGFILVEATAAGIRSLARLECVSAIIEDQSLGLIRPAAYPGLGQAGNPPS